MSGGLALLAILTIGLGSYGLEFTSCVQGLTQRNHTDSQNSL